MKVSQPCKKTISIFFESGMINYNCFIYLNLFTTNIYSKSIIIYYNIVILKNHYYNIFVNSKVLKKHQMR